MLSNYNDCLTRLLKDEGGYSNDAADPGGPTNYGITIADYRMYVNPTATADNIKNMKLDEAKAIYKTKYWGALSCDELPSGVDYVVFDYGVNSGISRSAKVLQRLSGTVDDGIIGAKTIEAVRLVEDKKKLINDICDERMSFLKHLSTFSVFGKGWTRRVEDGRKFAIALADKNAGTSAGPGGVIIGGAIAASQAPTHWVPWVLGGTVVAAIVVAGCIHWYKKWKLANVG